jgi:acetyl-CoA carboxylase carboxyltransferase component
MPVIESKLDSRSPEFQTNAAQLRGVVDDLKQQLARTALGGGDKARSKHTERGKLLPRERIRALLDSGSPFLEFSPLAAHGMYEAPRRPQGSSPASAVSTIPKSSSSPTMPRSRAARIFRSP